MSETQGGPATAELRRIYKLLRQLAKMAEHSSLTGSLQGGARDAADRYNLILKHLEASGVPVGPLFPPLPEDANFDRVGVASNLLAAYLEEDDEDKADPLRGVKQVHIGNIGTLGELKDIGRILREQLPELLTRGQNAPAGEARTPSGAGGPAHLHPMPPIPTGAPEPMSEEAPTEPMTSPTLRP